MSLQTHKYTPSPFHRDRNNFYLSGIDGFVRFPLFLGNITAKTNSPMYVPYSKDTLNQLLSFVKKLPLVTRDIHGQNQSCGQINQKTIFLNPLLKIAQKPSTIKNYKDLGTLYEAATHIGIKPLINLFAFYIANQIYPLSTSLDMALKQFHLNTQKVSVKNIEKHLHLKKVGIAELCVSDYVGLYGQPSIPGGKLDLSGEGLTSLEGLEFIIHSGEVTEIILDENYILFDESIPLKETISSFPQLKKMSFRGNRPSSLPLNSFHDMENIQLTL